jgi:hypothetical protein
VTASCPVCGAVFRLVLTGAVVDVMDDLTPDERRAAWREIEDAALRREANGTDQ